MDSPLSMPIVDLVLCQSESGNEGGKNVYAPRNTISLSSSRIRPYGEEIGKNGVALRDTQLKPVRVQNHGDAADFDHVRSFSEFDSGEPALLPQFLLQPDLPPPEAMDRQVTSRRRSKFELDETILMKKAQIHSSGQSNYEPEETSQVESSRAAASRWRDETTALGLKGNLRKRNRASAAKHRGKKRKAINCLQDDARDVGATNEILTQEIRLLRDQVSHWRNLALQHVDGEGGCGCAAIHMYNAEKAFQLIHGAESAAILSTRSPILQASIP